MENLNAEQVKKALECCSSSDGVSACESGCPYWGGDYDTCPCIEEPNFIIKNALALINSQEQRIKELGEENEKLTINMNAYGLTAKRLGEENERLRADCAKGANALIEEIQKNRTIEADTVRKIADLLWQGESEKLNISVGGKYYDKQDFIDQIAKEMCDEI